MNQRNNIIQRKLILKKNIEIHKDNLKNKENKLIIICKDIKQNNEEDKKQDNSPLKVLQFSFRKIKNVKLDKLNKKYCQKQNKLLVNKYGSEIFNFSKCLEQENLISSDFLFRHKISPLTRTKMVNWMCEIFTKYKLDIQTYFLSVSIMDKFFNFTKKILEDKDIHLIGLACIFLASKFEDLIPFQIYHIITEIGKNKFSVKQLLHKEKEILKEIKFNVLEISTFDFVNILIYDLKMNNFKKVRKLHLNKYLKTITNVSLFISQIILLDDFFSVYENSLKAICTLIFSFDYILSVYDKLNVEVESFIKQWILFIINESDFSEDEIYYLYNRLNLLYKQVKSVSEEGELFNVVKNFINENK